MAAPAFLTCFPVYCPHIPAPVSEKQEDTFPHVAAEEAKQCHRASTCLKKKDTAARHKENPHILTQAEFPFSNPIQWHN